MLGVWLCGKGVVECWGCGCVVKVWLSVGGVAECWGCG